MDSEESFVSSTSALAGFSSLEVGLLFLFVASLLALVILALRFPVHLVADFARGFLEFADALAEALGQLREFLGAKEQENGQKDNDPFPTLNKCQHVRVHW